QPVRLPVLPVVEQGVAEHEHAQTLPAGNGGGQTVRGGPFGHGLDHAPGRAVQTRWPGRGADAWEDGAGRAGSIACKRGAPRSPATGEAGDRGALGESVAGVPSAVTTRERALPERRGRGRVTRRRTRGSRRGGGGRERPRRG